MLVPRVHSLVVSLAILSLAQGVIKAAPYAPPPNKRVDFNLNADWKFIREDADGASKVAFDDKTWQTVSLPHTYNDTKFREWISTREVKKTGVALLRRHLVSQAFHDRSRLLGSQDRRRVSGDQPGGQVLHQRATGRYL